MQPAILWFRDDLRLADNPALTAIAASGRPLVALYVLEETEGRRRRGAASRWWLGRSLAALSAELASRGVPLVLKRGDSRTIIPDIVEASAAAAVHWNRRYDAAGRAIDTEIKAALKAAGIEAVSHPGNLLAEPWTLKPKSSAYFRVFTPFFKALSATLADLPPALPVPAQLAGWQGGLASDRIDDWGLQPTRPDWSGGLASTWTPGEAGAMARLAAFLEHRLAGYADARDRPAAEAVSRLSPHLAFGEISAAQLVRAARLHAVAHGTDSRQVDKFVAEVGWRDFSWHLAYHFPDLPSRNFQPRFDAFPWTAPDPARIAAWQRGMTGYPIVDAGMRELWQTGYMHNRVRMIVASFLVKNLLIDWRSGEDWFWDTLVDADTASNAASWQWVAGSGADAAPYFRVFNPVLQGEKFDPEGAYVRAYVPEVAALPDRYVHRPWEAPVPPRGYPAPIVDLSTSRDRALAAFAAL